ncbi:hypothetical protein T492DRAFT_935511 [Pavlovales sp. CCMP2436]|nr:hypothetical protein T492DRAFT_935511 [Pavlovales sp. CCMP2436]
MRARARAGRLLGRLGLGAGTARASRWPFSSCSAAGAREQLWGGAMPPPGLCSGCTCCASPTRRRAPSTRRARGSARPAAWTRTSSSGKAAQISACF